MKRLLSVLIILFLLLFPVALTFADGETDTSHIALTDGGKPTLVDNADLLNESQEKTLSERLKEIGTRYQCDVIVVTVNSLDGKTAEAYADDFFDYNGYGYGATPNAAGTTVDGDGIILLVSMEDRDYAVSTSGYGNTAFTDYGVQTYLEPMFLSHLSAGDYAFAFDRYADGCDELLKMARDGKPYDVEKKFSWWALILSVFGGGAAGFIPVNKMKRELTDVSKQTNADPYLEPNSFNLTQNSDVLLRTNVTRSVHVVQSESSGGRSSGGGGFHGGTTTHTSSSGGTHGGHSGKF